MGSLSLSTASIGQISTPLADYLNKDGCYQEEDAGDEG